MSRDGFLLPLVLLLLRAMTPVGRVEALLRLNRLVDMDLAAEDQKIGGWRPAENTEVCGAVSSYNTTWGRGQP
jgi:hypothetical protein